MRRATGTAILVLVLAGCGDEGPPRGGAGDIPPELIDRVIEPFNRGIALMDQYSPEQAVVAFEEVAAAAPDWVTGRLNLGIALLNSQTDEYYARAEEELLWVIERAPDNPYAHYALGMLLKHLNRLDEARPLFEEVLRIDPDDADAHFQLGVLLEDEDPEAARRHLETTLETMPHHESAVYRLATLLRRMGEPEESRATLLRFQELKSAGAGVATGMKYGEMGRYAEIVRTFGGADGAGGEASPPDYEDAAAHAGLTLAAGGTPGWPGAGNRPGAAAFGPGVAVADIRGDGDLAVYIPGAGDAGRAALYEGTAGRFSTVPSSGIEAGDAIGAFFGDYDGDGDPDLFLTRDGPNRLYRNDGNGRFADVTAEAGVAGGAVVSVGAAWADADHDGDLDLYVANYRGSGRRAGAPNVLWRNNGDGSFTEVATEAGIDGGSARTTGVLFFDVDADRDLDIYLLNQGSANRLFLNDRVGRYTDATEQVPDLADEGPSVGAALGDVDRNGLGDLLLLRGPEPPRLFLQPERGRFVEDAAFGATAERLGGAVGGLMGDLDLDGDLDLVLLGAGSEGATGHRILMNTGEGRFGPAMRLGPDRTTPDARGAVAVDFDGDGALELLVARAGAAPELWRAPAPPGRHWLQVIPVMGEDEGAFLVDPTASDMVVEVKAGVQLQVTSLGGTSGYLGSFPRRAHLGLGDHAKADYVRLSWSDAVLQSELEVPADQRWRVTKVERKPSSCPLLFAWDGERFAFITDFLGVGGVGFFMAPGEYSPPDPTEDVRIPPDLIRPRDGRYLLRVAEPLEEVTYLDQLHLVAYDHPAGWEVYPDERFGGASLPEPTGKPFAVAEKIFPEAATNHRGHDVLDRIRTIDRRYVEPVKDHRFVGYAEDHWLELDFGGRLQSLDPGARLVLYLYGWVEYTYSHVNYAAYQAGIAMQPPSIEVPDGRGGWRVAVADAGFPAGLPRMMTLDISALPIRDHGRMRIRSNMEIFWDQVFVAEDVAGGQLRSHLLPPVVAELRPLGYPREYSPDGANPTLYDYDRVDPGLSYKNLTGYFTRLGDVRELLAEVDDRFMVMARGEELALEFDARALPDLPPGWTRTFVLHSDGYCKDMDLYTAFPETVEPLPYHGMDNYPPTGPGPWNDADLAEYLRTWNTRYIEGR